MLNFFRPAQLGPKLTKFRDKFLSSIAFGLASYFCLNIERSVGSLVLGPILKGAAVSTSLAWITTGYFGLWAVSQMALRIQGRSETLGSQLKLLSLIGGGLIVHGAYYGLLEAGFKSSFALGVGGGLTAALTFAQSMVVWYMEPEKAPQSSDIRGLVTKAEREKYAASSPSKKPAAEPTKPAAKATSDSSEPDVSPSPSPVDVVGRPTTISTQFDASRAGNGDSKGATRVERSPEPLASKKKPT